MSKLLGLVIAMHLLAPGLAVADGILQHEDCVLNVGHRIHHKDRYYDARDALLHRGYKLTQKSSSIHMKHPTHRRPTYRLYEIVNVMGSGSSSDDSGRRILWEGQPADFPRCMPCPGSQTMLLRPDYFQPINMGVPPGGAPAMQQGGMQPAPCGQAKCSQDKVLQNW